MKKRCMSIMMTVILILGTALSVSAGKRTSGDVLNSVEDTKKLLLDLGYDEEEISLMPECEIRDYQSVKTAETKERYFRVDDNETSARVIDNGVVELSKEEFEREVEIAELEKEVNPLASDETLSSSGYLKAKVTLSILSDGNCKVTYTGTWVKKPANTKVDVAAALTNAGTLKSTSPVYYYSCTRKTYKDGVLSKTETLKEDTLGEKMSLIRNSAGCVLKRDLKDDTIQQTPTKNGKEFSNHKIYLSYKVTYEDRKQIAAEGYYFHQKGKVSASPSVSLGSDGTIGASLSVSCSNEMQHVTPNPYVDMKYK